MVLQLGVSCGSDGHTLMDLPVSSGTSLTVIVEGFN